MVSLSRLRLPQHKRRRPRPPSSSPPHHDHPSPPPPRPTSTFGAESKAAPDDDFDDAETDAAVDGGDDFCEIGVGDAWGGADAGLFTERLAACIGEWRKMGASELVCDWITNGYRFEWIGGQRPVPRRAPNRITGKTFVSDDVATKFVRREVQKMLVAGASIEVPSDFCKVVSPLSVAPKRGVDADGNSKLRLILDMRHTNSSVSKRTFRMESLKKARWSIPKNAWLSCLDISQAYYHLRVHDSDLPYVTFEFEGRWYAHRSLAFGFTTAPFLFTKVCRVMTTAWRKRGIDLLHYIDDFAVWSSSAERTSALHIILRDDMCRLGWALQPDKCTLDAALVPGLPDAWGFARQEVPLLGYIVNGKAHTFDIAPERRERIQASISLLLSLDAENGASPVELQAQVNGYICSLGLHLGPQVRLLMRSLQAVLNTGRNHRPGCTPEHRACRAGCYKGTSKLSANAIRDLQFVRDVLLNLAQGMPIWPVYKNVECVRLYTDASEFSMGAGLCGESRIMCVPLAGINKAHLEMRSHGEGKTSVVNHDPAKESSYLRELRAVLAGLQSLCSELAPGTTILLHMDAQSAYYNLGDGAGAKDPTASEVLREIWVWLAERQLHCAVRWVPREQNEWADFASKQLLTGDWQLRPSVFDQVCRHFNFVAKVDMFASADSHQDVPKWFSRWAAPGSAGDARGADWESFAEGIYAFPPPHMLEFTIRRAHQAKAILLLVAPSYSVAMWRRWLKPGPTGREDHKALRGMVTVGAGPSVFKDSTIPSRVSVSSSVCRDRADGGRPKKQERLITAPEHSQTVYLLNFKKFRGELTALRE